MPLERIGYAGKTGKLDSYQNPIVRVFTGTNQAANTEVTETVPTGKLWLLQSVNVTLVQGATQTPLPNLVITDGTNTLFTFPGLSSAMNASVTCALKWGQYLTLSAGGANTSATAPIPGFLYLPEGFKITTVTTGIGANSDYGAPIITVIEYS